VTFTRALLADSQWALKAAQAQAEPIRRCIGCNQCWGTASDGGLIRCSVNPTAGRESSLGPLQPAAVARRIVVIGAGPAGLEVARVAAARGHRVTVFEREARPGGKLVRAQLAPHQGELQHVLDFLVPAVAAHGVEVRVGVNATAALIAAERPDAVVVATGATIVTPELPGDGSVPVFSFDGGPIDVPGSGTIVVMDEDGYFWGAAAAEAMAATGRHVLLVTRFFEVLREVPITARIPTLRELDNAGADLLPNTFVESTDGGAVVLQNFRSGRRRRIEGASAVVWTGMQRARDGLVPELRALGIETHLIGDAMAQRRLMLAIQEAHDLARRL